MNRPKSLVSLVLIATFLLAQMPFGLAEWVSVAEAPDSTGVYSLIIEASHEGKRGTFALDLLVEENPYSLGNLTVKPVYPIPKEQPIDLRYDIELNGSNDFEMIKNEMSLYYVVGDDLLGSDEIVLTLEDDGYWHAVVNVPLKGEYKAVMSIIVEEDEEVYGGEFLTHFEVENPSPDLLIDYEVSEQVLTPAETFEVELQAVFEGGLLPDLDIFKANLYGTIKTLIWDEDKEAYTAEFTAPTKEGAYILSIYAQGQNSLDQETIYVAETAKEKSARCPLRFDELGGCTDMRDVRRCVSDYKTDAAVIEESELMDCFKTATGGIKQGSIVCDQYWKGDLDGDEHIDVDDLEVLQNLILPLEATGRQDYEECADYDLDGDIDNDDLLCLTNVVSEKWHGDFNGGICVESDYDKPLKGDFTGDDFVQLDDVAVMDYMLETVNAGIETPDEILDFADFDQDGRLGNEDRRCLMYFVGMDLDDPTTLLAGGDAIPNRCMQIYTLDDCQNIRGDINGDLIIDAVDEILIMLIRYGQVKGHDLGCSDVNKDGRVTSEDVECILSYTAGDAEDYFVCLGCDENTPPDYRFRAEICGDGVDNDCDGLVDRTAIGSADKCSCNEDTPCWMVKDQDGGANPGVNDGKLQVCRKVGWAPASDPATGSPEAAGYQWFNPEDLKCNNKRVCEKMECAGDFFKCLNRGSGHPYEWERNKEAWPETDSPNDDPLTCDDGVDNDCNMDGAAAGDMPCEEADSVLESGEFWTGLVLGGLGGYFLGPGFSFMAGLLSAGCGFVSDDGGVSSFCAGMGIGAAIGGLAGSIKTSGSWSGDDSLLSKDSIFGGKSTWITDDDGLTTAGKVGLGGGAIGGIIGYTQAQDAIEEDL